MRLAAKKRRATENPCAGGSMPPFGGKERKEIQQNFPILVRSQS